MNKQQFVHQLSRALRRLPSSERDDILRDYEEHFAIGRQQGKNEEEIAVALGSPEQIAKELLTLYHLDRAEASATLGNVVRAVWAAVGLGFFNLVIVLGPLTALTALVLGGWVAGIAGVAAPFLVLIMGMITPASFNWFDLLISVALCGGGLLLTMGMYYATPMLARGLVRYLKFNVTLVKGGMKHV